MPYIIVTIQHAIHRHCHDTACHTSSLSRYSMPYIIIVTIQHAIHHHCHATACHTSSLSRYSMPYIIIVMPQHAIHHHCHTTACHTPLSRHSMPYIIVTPQHVIHQHCHALTCHTSHLLCSNTATFLALAEDAMCGTTSWWAAIQIFCHAACRTPSLSRHNTPIFWPWQQMQCVGRPAGVQRTSPLSRYMTYVIMSCYISYIIIVTP